MHRFTTGMQRLAASWSRPLSTANYQRFGGSNGGGSAPRDMRPPQGGANYGNTPSEPQLVAKLLELFPMEHTWVPVSKWVQVLPADVQEALVPYGGLANFSASQSNFFIIRKENGVAVAALSTMGAGLCIERTRQQEKKEKMRMKMAHRRGGGGGRGGAGRGGRGRDGSSDRGGGRGNGNFSRDASIGDNRSNRTFGGGGDGGRRERPVSAGRFGGFADK